MLYLSPRQHALSGRYDTRVPLCIRQGDGKRHFVAVDVAVLPLERIGGVWKAVAGLKMSGLSVDCVILHVTTSPLSQELTKENEDFCRCDADPFVIVDRNTVVHGALL